MNGKHWKECVEQTRTYGKRKASMDIINIIAIDVHTHAHIPRHVSDVPGDPEVREAARRYFKQEGSSPTLPEIAAYYRERKMA